MSQPSRSPAPPAPEWVRSQEELALALGVHRRTLADWIAAEPAVPDKTPAGYNVAAWRAWRRKRRDRRRRYPRQDPEFLRLRQLESRRIWTHAELLVLERDVERECRELAKSLPGELAGASVTAARAKLRGAFEGILGRVRAAVAEVAALSEDDDPED